MQCNAEIVFLIFGVATFRRGLRSKMYICFKEEIKKIYLWIKGQASFKNQTALACTSVCPL